MLNISQTYETRDGRSVKLVGSKMIGGVRIYVGEVSDTKGYRHWHENGTVFGDKDKNLNLKGE